MKKLKELRRKGKYEAVDATDTGGAEEVSMAVSQIKAMRHYLDGIEKRVRSEGDMEEWYQNKLTKANDYLKTLYGYSKGKTNESTELDEAVQFKVDVEGLPPTFMTGKSSAEILAKLRKIVKQPSMIKNVERHTDMEVRKAYRNKAQGREMDEAVYGNQAQRMMSPLQKARQDKEKADRDKDGKLHMMKGRPKKVNEISQDLKKRYTDKAKSDYGHQQFSADIAREMGAKDAEKYYRRKQRNRMAGITKANK